MNIFNLNHDNFESLAPEVLRKLGNTELFTDVTLVSSEGQCIKGHKAILASFSEIVYEMLVDNPQPNPIIYMNNIDSNMLQMMKHFIYYGSVQVPTDLLDMFIRIGWQLRVAGLMAKEDTNEFEAEINVSKEKLEHDNEVQTEYKPNCATEVTNDVYTTSDLSESEKEMNFSENVPMTKDFSFNHPENFTLIKEQGLYRCERCKYSSRHVGHVKQHILSIHEHVKYECQQCDHKAKTPQDLRRHIRSVHDKVTYDCKSCDYKTTRPTHLRHHIQTKH